MASIKTEFELRLKGMMSKERECKPRYLILQDKLSISFRFLFFIKYHFQKLHRHKFIFDATRCIKITMI